MMDFPVLPAATRTASTPIAIVLYRSIFNQLCPWCQFMIFAYFDQ
ncbi:hypothetical protein D1AOALGA4SA_10539 [Olavius algarvensis Delta 1 endosymbiont]|nr:hypothetical protein D1AOALGA4SA_10539 [Olavius algarvensis Delta 1 endosymbiont]